MAAPTRRNGHVAIAEADQRILEIASQRDSANEMLSNLQERILELENAADGWIELNEFGMGGGVGSGTEFSRRFLDQIVRLSRLYYLKNPLIKRAIQVKSAYVHGQGVSIHARHPDVNAALQTMLDDPDNRAELFGQQALLAKEVDLECDGNLFLSLFVNRSTGRMRVRTIPTEEIRDVIRNPEDRREVWFYQRLYGAQDFSYELGLAPTQVRTEYYPDWRYVPTQRSQTIAGGLIHWESPIYHVKIGAFSNWKFGCPEVYAALDWAKAYKEELEDDATRSRALARFVFQMTTRGGKAGVAAAKAKLSTTFGTGGSTSLETNPPPVAGSTFIGTEGVTMQAMNLSGATLPPDHSRPHRLMVASAVGLPDTILAGDPDQSNLATAKTLDRPTELEMTTRQGLWRDMLLDLLNYRIDQCALAPEGPLKGRKTQDADGRDYIELDSDPLTGVPMDRHIDVDFPPILEHSVLEEVQAIIAAATLGSTSGTLAGTMPLLTVAKLLLSALRVPDIDEILEVIEADAEAAAQKQAEAEAAATEQAKLDAEAKRATVTQPVAQPPVSTPEPQTPAVESGALSEGPPYDFSSTQMNVTGELAEQIAAYQNTVDPNDLASGGLETQPHITVLYGLWPAVSGDDVARVLAGQPPITVTFGEISSFPEVQDGVPLIVLVNSPGIHQLHELLADELAHTDTHLEYQPHLTLAYLKPEAVEKYTGVGPLSGQSATLDTVMFSGSDGSVRDVMLKAEAPVAT